VDDTFLCELDGYRTVGASANVFAGETFGFDRFFDEFSSINRFGVLRGGINPDTFHREHPDGASRFLRFLKQAYDQGELVASVANGGLVKVNDVLDKLSMRRFGDYGLKLICREVDRLVTDEPYFLFANFMEAHGPHQPTRSFDATLFDVPSDWSSNEFDPWDVNNSDSTEAFEEHLSRWRDLYGASVDYLDRKLATYVADLVERSDGETSVVITADHGEELAFPADGGRLGHAAGFSNALLHVPMLVVNAPTTADADTEALVSHLDLGELLVGLSRGTLPDISRTQVPAERVGLSEERRPENFAFWDRLIRCVFEGGKRYEWDSLGQSAVYRVTGPSTEGRVEDEKSAFDVSALETRHFDVDAETYKRQARDAAELLEVDEATERRLRQLGYM
jgi:arylsulfatase A-like enzyme